MDSPVDLAAELPMRRDSTLGRRDDEHNYMVRHPRGSVVGGGFGEVGEPLLAELLEVAERIFLLAVARVPCFVVHSSPTALRYSPDAPGYLKSGLTKVTP